MSKPTFKETKIIHAQIMKTPFLQSNISVANSLADCYCKSSAMVYARNVFDQIPQPNLASWNLMISGYNQALQFDWSQRIFCRMHSNGLKPNKIAYGSIVSACAASHCLQFGKQVYCLVTKSGFFSDAYVCTGMIDLFAKSFCFNDAISVFSEASYDNVVCWNAIIAGGVRNKENWISLDIFRQMVQEFLSPNGHTFSTVLTACAAIGWLHLGKVIHSWVIKCGVEDDIFVGTAIVDMYVKCGDLDEAFKEFSQMPHCNHVSWTAIISGFVQASDCVNALKLFKEMKATGVEINTYTITSVLAACAALAKEAIQIHALILKSGLSMDSSVAIALINTYAKLGDINLSERVFEETRCLETVGTWSSMISCFAQNNSLNRAIDMFQGIFQEGLRPDTVSSSSVLSIISCIGMGKEIHCYVVKAGLDLNVAVGSAVFTMYSKCGSLEDSYSVFKHMPEKDGVSWTSMIAGFAEHDLADRAFCLFKEMLFGEVIPDQMTVSALLTASTVCQSLQTGKEIHGYALRIGLGSEMLLGSGLVNMYSRCKDLVSARRIFDAMRHRDQIAWSSLVSGYAQNRNAEEALSQFHQMLIAGMEIDHCTVTSILAVSATMTRFSLGKQLHAHAVKTGFESDLPVSSSLVTLYSKCGKIDDSRKIFDQIDKPDLITWTTLISSYAEHGQGEEALNIYEMMRKEGIKPDSVTFIGVLSACSHNGLVEEAYFHLNSMVQDYGIKPEACHYACMVDLLSRAGRLKEAKKFIETMPVEPDALMWGTLLGACKLHGNVEIGISAAKKVLELDPIDSGAYVSLSNICADAGDWEEVLKIRKQMKGHGVKKEPGWSFL
ncbi:hypothetical protein ACLOJK_022469 [Asimina triloba]